MSRKSLSIMLFVLRLAIGLTPVQAQEEMLGISVTCPDGTVIENGFEILVFSTETHESVITALGIDEFDPVIAVGADRNNIEQCNDNARSGFNYSASLPSTGNIPNSTLTAQVSLTLAEAESMSVIVGDTSGRSGEALLLIEDLLVSPADGTTEVAGDTFSTRLMPNMITSAVPLSMYMLGVDDNVDPIVLQISGGEIPASDGELIRCDDAGNPKLCMSNTESLVDAAIVVADGEIVGGAHDAMLRRPLDVYTDLNEDIDFRFLNWRFRNYDLTAEGEYVAAFHFGINNG